MQKSLLFELGSYIGRESEWGQEEAEGLPSPRGVAISLEIAKFRPVGMFYKSEVNNSKWLQEVPETDQIR